MTPNKATQIVE